MKLRLFHEGEEKRLSLRESKGRSPVVLVRHTEINPKKGGVSGDIL